MGNAVTKKFDNVPKDPTASAGHLKLWNIYPGTTKDSLNNPVSIWTFDKSELSKRKVNAISDKTVCEQLYLIMKKDLQILKDSKGCANIVQVQFTLFVIPSHFFCLCILLE